MEIFENKRKTVLTLRWLLIIALSYLLLFQEKESFFSESGRPAHLFSFLVIFYIFSNILLLFAPKKIFEHRWFDLILIIGDTGIVSSSMFLTHLSTSSLMIFYFLIILMTTFGQGLKGIVGNGFLLIGVYVLFQIKEMGYEHFISDSLLLLQIPFLMIAMIFYGILVDQAHRRYHRTLDEIKRVSEIIGTTLNLREVYRSIMDALINLLGAEQCSIMLLDPEGETLTIQDARGLSEEVILSTKQRVGEGIAGYVVKENKPLILNSPQAIGKEVKSLPSAPNIVSAISVPLRTKNRVIGVMNISVVSGHKRFTTQDLNILTLFASESAAAIENARLFEEVQVKGQELKAVHMDVIMAFAGSLESKDVYTGGHAQRLSIYAEMIAKNIQLREEEIERLKFAAVLHDVGKIAVPDRILLATGKLEPEEMEIMKTHSEKGALMISQIPSLTHLARYIRHHHERWDGNGYPDKIKGKSIHLFSRIIAVCDTYDAITTNRSYQKAFEPEEVIKILKQCRGTQLDPEIIDVFLGLIIKNDGLFKLSVPVPGQKPNGSGLYPLEPLVIPLKQM